MKIRLYCVIFYNGGREGYSINIKVVLLSFEMEVPILHYVIIILFHSNISD